MPGMIGEPWQGNHEDNCPGLPGLCMGRSGEQACPGLCLGHEPLWAPVVKKIRTGTWQRQELNVFMSLPELICTYLNEGKHEDLLELVNEYFEEDCTVRTEAMDENNSPDLIGRDSITNLMLGVYEACPDSLCCFKSATLNMEDNPDFAELRSVVSYSGTETDTKSKHSHLYKPFNPNTQSYDVNYTVKVATNSLVSLLESEIAVMAEKEKDVREGKALAYLECESITIYTVSRATYKICRAEFYWQFKSFDAVAI